MTKTQMEVVIFHLEREVEVLKRNMCIYAREELGFIDFDGDKDCIKFFSDFAKKHDNT